MVFGLGLDLAREWFRFESWRQQLAVLGQYKWPNRWVKIAVSKMLGQINDPIADFLFLYIFFSHFPLYN